MKNIIKKTIKFVSSRALYLLIGLFLALAISAAYAAWDSTVNPGDSLTSTIWNEHVNKLVELDDRNLSCITEETNGAFLEGVVFELSVDCPGGYIRTGCSEGVEDIETTWVLSPDVAPLGNGCRCRGYAMTGVNAYCYAYCCKME